MKKEVAFQKNIHFLWIRYFLLVFISSIFVISLFSGILIYYKYQADKNNKIEAARDQLVLKKEEIVSALDEIISDLYILENIKQFRMLLMNTAPERAKKNVQQVFLLTMSGRKIYDQIRFLGSDGMELIRVNYNSGNPLVVSDSDLQNKGQRYYFQDTYILKNGEVFFSPFDLNIENGEIELPLKPMIRVGIPVFNDEGEKKGILLVNYLGQQIINSISSRYSFPVGEVMLLNSDSYWLYSGNPDDNWGFMYKERKERTFSIRYPQAWDEIMESFAGSSITDEGIFIYESIYPLYKDMVSSTGSGEAYGRSEFYIASEDYFWKLVVFLPEKMFSKMLKSHVLDIAPIYSIFLVIISIFSGLLTKSKIIQIQANEELKRSLDEKELLLREIHHRVKNSLALVSSFVGLYRSNYTDKSNNDVCFNAVQRKIDTISLVHTYLYQSSDIENINLKSYLQDLLESMLNNLGSSTGIITLTLVSEDIFMTAQPTISVGLIISELAMNSLKHAFPDNRNGTITVNIRKLNSDYIINYADDGPGLPEDFKMGDSDSMGMILIKALTEQLEGNLRITTGPDSTFTITFPVTS